MKTNTNHYISHDSLGKSRKKIIRPNGIDFPETSMLQTFSPPDLQSSTLRVRNRSTCEVGDLLQSEHEKKNTEAQRRRAADRTTGDVTGKVKNLINVCKPVKNREEEVTSSHSTTSDLTVIQPPFDLTLTWKWLPGPCVRGARDLMHTHTHAPPHVVTFSASIRIVGLILAGSSRQCLDRLTCNGSPLTPHCPDFTPHPPTSAPRAQHTHSVRTLLLQKLKRVCGVCDKTQHVKINYTNSAGK